MSKLYLGFYIVSFYFSMWWMYHYPHTTLL